MSNGHIRYFSDLRAISCISIVVLHTFYCADRLFSPGGVYDEGSMIVRNCMMFAVPCFVMISGALLLNPERKVTVERVFSRYLKRILIALVVFTFIFSLFDMIADHQEGGFPGLIKNWLTALLFNKSWLHMWYLYMLIGLYLMLPIYRIISKNCSDAELRYLLVLYLIFQSVIPTIGYATGVQIGFYILIYTVYPLYFFMGYALHSGKVKIPAGMAVLMVLVSTVLLVVTTYFGIHYQNDNLQSLSSSYACILAFFQAVGFFALMMRTEKKKDRRISYFLNEIDKCSFGIYLIHVLVLYTIYRVFDFNPYIHGGLLMLLLLTIVTFALSWLIVRLLKNIPYIKNIL
ncbi:MAG: acyltransferase [Eubacteriales bacterium]|jgi:surface polysaccharide O-acyltransferase-like enzyme